jgi:phage terminase large subunit-like protein
VAEFKGEPCFMALDLATRDDIAPLAMLFDRDGDLYYAGEYFLPKDVVDEKAASTHQNYAAWAATGHFTLTPGTAIDYDMIRESIRDKGRVFQVERIGFDPWQATQLSMQLEKDGATCVEIKPTIANFSEPMKELRSLVRQGRFHHGGDPVLTWCVSNVVAKLDGKDNIYPTKEYPEKKIDAAVATIMAMALWVRAQSEVSRYDEDPDAEILVV